MKRSNKYLTAKDRSRLKGAIRRAFAYSEHRKAAIDATRITHQDKKRPKVKHWSQCPECKKKTPTYLMQVDHIDPVIPISLSFTEMSIDEVVERSWCHPENLKAICKPCHAKKTERERILRKLHKDGRAYDGA